MDFIPYNYHPGQITLQVHLTSNTFHVSHSTRYRQRNLRDPRTPVGFCSQQNKPRSLAWHPGRGLSPPPSQGISHHFSS